MKFLFCEDDRDAIDLSVKFLTKDGFVFDFVSVDTESRFIQEMSSSNVLFVDCSIPSFSCEEAVIHWIKFGKCQPFIVISGTISKHKVILLTALGVTDCVLKENLAELGAVTRRALREFELKDKLAVLSVDRTVIHGIRNSLTIIRSNLDYLMHIKEFDLECCKAIMQGAKQITNTIQDLESVR